MLCFSLLPIGTKFAEQVTTDGEAQASADDRPARRRPAHDAGHRAGRAALASVGGRSRCTSGRGRRGTGGRGFGAGGPRLPDWGLEDELSYLRRGGTPSPMQFIKTLARADPVGEVTGVAVTHVEAMQAIHRSWASFLAYKREYEARTRTQLIAASSISVSERNIALQADGISSLERIPMHFQTWQREFRCTQQSCLFAVSAEVSLLRCGQWVVLIRSGRFYHGHDIESLQSPASALRARDQLDKLRSVTSCILDELSQLNNPSLGEEIQLLERYLSKLQSNHSDSLAVQVVQKVNSSSQKPKRTTQSSPKRRSSRHARTSASSVAPSTVESGNPENARRLRGSIKPSPCIESRDNKTVIHAKAKRTPLSTTHKNSLDSHFQTPLMHFFRPVESSQTLALKASEAREFAAKARGNKKRKLGAPESTTATPKSNILKSKQKTQLVELNSSPNGLYSKNSVSPLSPMLGVSNPDPGVDRVDTQGSRQQVSTSQIPVTELEKSSGDHPDCGSISKESTTPRRAASTKGKSSTPRLKNLGPPRKARRKCSSPSLEWVEDHPVRSNRTDIEPDVSRTRASSRAPRPSVPTRDKRLRSDASNTAAGTDCADLSQTESSSLKGARPRSGSPRISSRESRVAKGDHASRASEIGIAKPKSRTAKSTKMNGVSTSQSDQETAASLAPDRLSSTCDPLARRTRVLKVKLVSKSRAESSSSPKPVLQIPLPRVNLIGKAPAPPADKSNEDSEWEVVLVPRSIPTGEEALSQPLSKKKQRAP